MHVLLEAYLSILVYIVYVKVAFYMPFYTPHLPGAKYEKYTSDNNQIVNMTMNVYGGEMAPTQ
jgi:hypothetical protein